MLRGEFLLLIVCYVLTSLKIQNGIPFARQRLTALSGQLASFYIAIQKFSRVKMNRHFLTSHHTTIRASYNSSLQSPGENESPVMQCSWLLQSSIEINQKTAI